MPTRAAGLIEEPQQAEQIVATGPADIVMIGRELLRDPNVPLRTALTLGVEIDDASQRYHRAPITRL